MRLSRALSRAAGKGKQSSWKGARQRNSAKPRARHCQPRCPAGSSLHEWGALRGRECSAGAWGHLPLQLPPAHPAHRAAASAQSLSPAPSESGHHASPPLGLHFTAVPSRGCHQAGGWRGPAGLRGCCNPEEPHLPLPLTARSLQHFAIHKQRQLQRESEGGRSWGRGGSFPAGAHWLRPLSHAWPLAGSGYLQTLSPPDRWPNDITHSLLF